MAELSRPPASVADAYDRWASTYDAELNRTRSIAASALRSSSIELAGRHVVEVGCGTGQNTSWLAERAGAVLGLDVSQGMLARALAHVTAPNVAFRRHDIRDSWPVEAGSAGAVVAMLVLEHIEHLGVVFAEAARVLEPGGELFFCELHPMRQLLGSQARFTPVESGEVELVSAFGHDVSDYVNAAIGAGFQLLHLRECRDEGAAFEAPPRILSALCRRGPR